MPRLSTTRAVSLQTPSPSEVEIEVNVPNNVTLHDFRVEASNYIAELYQIMGPFTPDQCWTCHSKHWYRHGKATVLMVYKFKNLDAIASLFKLRFA